MSTKQTNKQTNKPGGGAYSKKGDFKKVTISISVEIV